MSSDDTTTEAEGPGQNLMPLRAVIRWSYRDNQPGRAKVCENALKEIITLRTSHAALLAALEEAKGWVKRGDFACTGVSYADIPFAEWDKLITAAEEVAK